MSILNSLNSSARIIFLLSMVLLVENIYAETVPMHTLSNQPKIDGAGIEWKNVPFTRIKLHKSKSDAGTETQYVDIKGGIYKEHACFYLEWPDNTENTVHKPWVWDKNLNKYIRGPQREDRLAIQFSMNGDYSTDWFSGNNFTADMWHWKAGRSNPLGLAHDKLTNISSLKLLRAYKGKDRANNPLYIGRPSDSGTPLYTTKRYRSYQKDLMPKYILNHKVQGSVADVKAKGQWHDGKWHLELCRAFNTGHSDDITFAKNQNVIGGLAVFDQSENDDHGISDILLFEF